jgi:biopolymer transport protein ExbD
MKKIPLKRNAMRIQAKILVSALFALLLSACEKPSDQGSQVKAGPKAKKNTQSPATLPLLWQEKGGMAEATEDLMALHVAMQRYLKANNDIWPQAPPADGKYAAYREFWESTLKPFGATAQHWQHSGNPPLPGNPAFFEANRFNEEKGAAYREKNGGEEKPHLRWDSTPDGALGGHWWFATEVGKLGRVVFITASGRVVDTQREFVVEVPAESPNQSLAQNTGSLIMVNIHKNGAYIVKGKLVTMEGLTKWMSEECKKNPELKVLIRCDVESKHLYLANVMSICRHVGVPEANIAVRTEK